jgi:transcriptional regulator with XRE-family HTH domain
MTSSEIDPSVLEKESARWERVAGIVLAGTRRDLEVSQRELANRLGWSRNMIANIESGRRSMNLGEFIIVAHALNVGPEILLQRILRWGHSRRPESQRLA